MPQNNNLTKLGPPSGLKEWVKVSKITGLGLWNCYNIVIQYFALRIKDFTYQKVEIWREKIAI